MAIKKKFGETFASKMNPVIFRMDTRGAVSDENIDIFQVLEHFKHLSLIPKEMAYRFI